MVTGRHRPPAGAAGDDPLAQGLALPGRAGAGIGQVRSQTGLVGQVVVPADVAGVVAVDDDGPLFPGQLGDLGADRAVGLDDPAGVVTAEHVGAGIGRVGQHPQHPGMGEPAPAQLAGPHPAVGPQREAPAP